VNYKTTNFVKIMPSRIFKLRVLAQLESCHVLRDMGKSERAGEQESLHTAVGPSVRLHNFPDKYATEQLRS
jgi:hypothetical protein